MEKTIQDKNVSFNKETKLITVKTTANGDYDTEDHKKNVTTSFIEVISVGKGKEYLNESESRLKMMNKQLVQLKHSESKFIVLPEEKEAFELFKKFSSLFGQEKAIEKLNADLNKTKVEVKKLEDNVFFWKETIKFISGK